MAIQPIVTAWAHVRVMMKRRVLAQVLLEELAWVESMLPATHPQAAARDVERPRPRYLPRYPADYVVYFDAETARRMRDYLNALDDYTGALAAERGSAGAVPEDPLWRHARILRRVGAELRAALAELAGKRDAAST